MSGHGIGLDIVKQLCDLMDINISVSSVVGEGTLIVIRF
ncbi:MAG TPA: ATP-binding protein [Sulfurimonas sp.]|nr:ATP-binding protein [Sulfurimonas sp.]HIM75471.1 ATP-binding protein [Campylobacterales bacterium]